MKNTWAFWKLSALSDWQKCSANYESAGEVENVPPLGGVHIKLKLKEEHISGGHIVHWKTNMNIGKENTKKEIWKYAHVCEMDMCITVEWMHMCMYLCE